MYENSRGTIIEGVGDEVVYGLAMTLCAVVPLILSVAYWLRRSDAPQVIHPDSQENVQDARQRLRAQNLRQENGGSDADQSQPRTQGEVTCPICLADARYATETNCGHIFCGTCIITYWTHGSWLGPVRCPVCRQRVTMLLFNFSEEESRESEERNTITGEINTYNRRFSGEPRPMMDYIRDLPTLLRHAISEFFSMGGLLVMFRLRIIVCFIAAIIYFISPLDIIPEAVFGILGFLDDIFILLLLAIYVSIIYRQVVESRARAE